MDIVDTPPVVLLGRGGSGTRLLSELARGLGVFLGNEINVSGDSVEWVDTIYPLAIEAMECFGRPSAERADARARRLRRHAAKIVPAEGGTRAAAWGWKLPETMLIVSDVARAFPQARFVHLVRHPTTSSLRRTHMTSRPDNPIGTAVLCAAYRERGRDPDQAARDDDSVRNALTWDFQVRHVTDALAALPRTAAGLVLRYEDLCASPGGAGKQLARFLSLSEAVPQDALPAIEPDRMGTPSFGDARAAAVWSICGATAARLGYSFEHP